MGVNVYLTKRTEMSVRTDLWCWRQGRPTEKPNGEELVLAQSREAGEEGMSSETRRTQTEQDFMMPFRRVKCQGRVSSDAKLCHADDWLAEGAAVHLKKDNRGGVWVGWGAMQVA